MGGNRLFRLVDLVLLSGEADMTARSLIFPGFILMIEFVMIVAVLLKGPHLS